MWKWMTSNSPARANTSSSMRTWWADRVVAARVQAQRRGRARTSSARVFESPLANNVTSWPEVDQLLGQEVNDPLGAAVQLRRHALV